MPQAGYVPGKLPPDSRWAAGAMAACGEGKGMPSRDPQPVSAQQVRIAAGSPRRGAGCCLSLDKGLHR